MYTIKPVADGPDLDQIRPFKDSRLLSGFTANPTLMRKAGVQDFAAFSKAAAEMVSPLPISIEVLADDFEEMGRQARVIASWAPNVFVKIPVTNTASESSAELVRQLASEGVKLNITAIFTVKQVAEIANALNPEVPSVVSVFAGRIADAGVDPMPIMAASRALLDDLVPTSELLWASPREILNLEQAEAVGADIITMTPDLWAKYTSLGKDLNRFSQETVQMFFDDAVSAGFKI